MAREREDGLEALQGRVQRRPRHVPPPKRPREEVPTETPEDEGAVSPSKEQEPRSSDLRSVPSSLNAPKASKDPDSGPGRRTAELQGPVEAGEKGLATVAPAGATTTRRLGPREPLANLAVRVRRPLDRLLGRLVHELQDAGIRTSKAELVELLLWELPEEPTPALRARLAAFRQDAPREQQP